MEETLSPDAAGACFAGVWGLSASTNLAAYRALRADRSRWLPVALDIARSHGLEPARRTSSPPAPTSSWGLSRDIILKMFPPLFRGQFVSERGSLAQLRGPARSPIPEIVFEGERDGWPYLVITRLVGYSRRAGMVVTTGRG